MNRMTREEYMAYMKSPEWKAIRAERLKLDDSTCQHCGACYVPLQIHHITYKRLGEERLEDLISLCETCHKKEHERIDQIIAVRRAKQIRKELSRRGATQNKVGK